MYNSDSGEICIRDFKSLGFACKWKIAIDLHTKKVLEHFDCDYIATLCEEYIKKFEGLYHNTAGSNSKEFSRIKATAVFTRMLEGGRNVIAGQFVFYKLDVTGTTSNKKRTIVLYLSHIYTPSTGTTFTYWIQSKFKKNAIQKTPHHITEYMISRNIGTDKAIDALNGMLNLIGIDGIMQKPTYSSISNTYIGTAFLLALKRYVVDKDKHPEYFPNNTEMVPYYYVYEVFYKMMYKAALNGATFENSVYGTYHVKAYYELRHQKKHFRKNNKLGGSSK